MQVAYQVRIASYSLSWGFTRLHVSAFGLPLYRFLQKTYSHVVSQKKNFKNIENVQVFVT